MTAGRSPAPIGRPEIRRPARRPFAARLPAWSSVRAILAAFHGEFAPCPSSQAPGRPSRPAGNGQRRLAKPPLDIAPGNDPSASRIAPTSRLPAAAHLSAQTSLLDILRSEKGRKSRMFRPPRVFRRCPNRRSFDLQKNFRAQQTRRERASAAGNCAFGVDILDSCPCMKCCNLQHRGNP